MTVVLEVMCIFNLKILQVYYELDEERKKVNGTDVAICRVEQLCPFPYDLVQRELKRYPSKSTPALYRELVHTHARAYIHIYIHIYCSASLVACKALFLFLFSSQCSQRRYISLHATLSPFIV